MTARNHDNTGPGRYNNGKVAHSRPPPPGQARKVRARIAVVRVARIETVPMTPAEYDNAVEALAVLIARWHQAHGGDSDPDRNCYALAA